MSIQALRGGPGVASSVVIGAAAALAGARGTNVPVNVDNNLPPEHPSQLLPGDTTSTPGALSGDGNVATTVTITASAVVGKVASGTVATTATITAAGLVGKLADGAVATTATITAGALVGKVASGSVATTATINATGVVGKVASGTVATTVSITASASVTSGNTASGNVATTATINATAIVGRRPTPAPLDTFVTITATAVVTSTTYHFEPPIHEEPIRSDIHPLIFYRLTYAASIVRVGGVLTSIRTPSHEVLVAAGVEGRDYFMGGHIYQVEPDVQAELVAAGFTT